MKSIRYTVAFLLLVLPLQAATNHASRFIHSMEEQVQQALKKHPALEARKANWQAASATIQTSGALPDPTVQATYFVDPVQTRTGPQEWQYRISQQLPWLGTLHAREEAATARAEAAHSSYRNGWNQRAAKLTAVGIEWSYLDWAIQLADENIALLQDLEPVVESRVASGAPLNTMLRLKLEIGKLEDQRATLVNQLDMQQTAWQGLAGGTTQTLRQLPALTVPPETHLDSDRLQQLVTEQHPRLQQLVDLLTAATADEDKARLNTYPSFTVGMHLFQTGDPTVNPDTPDAGEDPWGVTIGMSLPFWPQKNQAQRAQAQAEKYRSEYELEDTRIQLSAALNTAELRYRDAFRRIRLNGEDLLSLAQQALENTQTAYESGQQSLLDVIDSERSLLELQLAYWRAAADAWQAHVQVQTLIGQSPFVLQIGEHHE